MALSNLNEIYEIKFRMSAESVPVYAQFQGTQVSRVDVPAFLAGTEGKTRFISIPRWLTDIYQFEIQPVTWVPTSHESDSRLTLSESEIDKNGFDICVPAPRSFSCIFVSAAILCCWKYTWLYKEKLQFDQRFLIILTYFQIIRLTKLYNFWVFCPEKATMVPGDHKNKNFHVFFFNDIPFFMLVKVAGAAFFGWENQNILSPDAFSSSSGRPARHSLHGRCNPSILTKVFHWPHRSRENSKPDA